METSAVFFERLDNLIEVTTIHGWIALSALFALCAGAVIFAVLYPVPKKVVGEGIMLIDHDRLSQVRALGTGRLKKLRVGLGDEVRAGMDIGEISQEDLKAAIRETEARLQELRREDIRLTDFEADESQTQDQAIARLQASISKTIQNSLDGLSVAEKIVDGALRLRSVRNLTNIDYLKDLQQKFTIQNDLNNGHSRLAELQLTRLTSENLRKRAQLQRRLEISKQETRLSLDREKLVRTSRIEAHVQGKVTQVLTAADEFVREGAPIVLLSSPKTDPGTDDDAGKPYESIVFVPAGEGKKIDEGDFVEVSPATIKREEHGYIHGCVVAVSELPATRLAMDAALQHPDLVEAFTKKYAPGVLLRIHVMLKPRSPKDPQLTVQGAPAPRGNRFHWSSRSGFDQPLKTGTMCEAAIVVEQQPLISLVIPWTKRLLGYD
jgi:HlyD family secretion protein